MPRKGVPANPAQKAALARGRKAAHAAARESREAKASTDAKSEAEIYASIMAGLPPGERSSQERTLARWIAREQVQSDRLSAWLEFNRQHSREAGRKLKEAHDSMRLLRELQRDLQLASKARVNAANRPNAGQPVKPRSSPEHVLATTLILLRQGALGPHASPEAREQAKTFADTLERDKRERAAVAAEFDDLPTTGNKEDAHG